MNLKIIMGNRYVPLGYRKLFINLITRFKIRNTIVNSRRISVISTIPYLINIEDTV